MRLPMIGLVLTSIIMSVSSFATNQNFNKRFQVVRNDDGKVVEIRDASLSRTFSIWPYVEYITEALEAEKDLMAQKGDYDYEVESLLTENAMEMGLVNSEEVEKTILAMKQLQNIDLKAMLQDPAVNEVINGFEKRITEVLAAFNPTVVARLDNPVFFYQRNVTYQVLVWALDFARKKLSSIPVLNTVAYILKESEKLIANRRVYHQNMLLHYFERIDAKEIGMTNSEVDLAYSSIYESRIPWFAIWESKAAKADWEKYGVNKFFGEFRAGSTVLRNNKFRYTSTGERINYAFQEAVYKDESVIVNLVNKESMLNSMPAISYSYDAPKKVKRLRTILQLGQLGISFVPVSATIKDMVTKFMKSYYEEQSLTEGALYAHFDLVGNDFMKSELVEQMVNPFETEL
ncbi:hypothetical protein M899_2017 [Bacteriovorax sp. BSW11_IV]|uniref:hypothetical protein n=1 Tax=Bacteriovorax sp. BSW11_IV TaxID=1353529 RepID=UPI00038A459F|nr:hypothetical protein [Bacteriovorax sp. BSW11_IV]EQC46376.1 hypothetical protein M899_2017 [Bacteriovorax sp. BSW11_IV]